MKEKDVAEAFRKAGAILSGHFVLKSGKHADTYMNKDGIYPFTEVIRSLCASLAHETSEFDPQVVVGPALGGIILSQWVAHHYCDCLQREVLAVYAEKGPDNKSFAFSRGYDRIVRGKRVLIVEDVLTTGSSVKAVVELVRETGGSVVGVGALVNRGGVLSGALMVPKLRCLLSLDLPDYNESDCPLCRDDVPINTDVGKGREYLARKQQSAS